MTISDRTRPSPAGPEQSNEPESVRFEHVDKSYGSTEVLKDFNIDIEAGSMVSFLGPSGCGKTTTLRILAGFEPVNGGDVLVGGESVLKLPPNSRDMGMVFQSYSLFPNLSVSDNIEYGLQIRKVDAGARRRRTEELLEICGLTGMGGRFPHQLSGGQQQRVALARALVIRPSSRRSFCSTSRCRHSTPRSVPHCVRRSGGCSRRWAPPRSSSHTIRERRWRSPTVWP